MTIADLTARRYSSSEVMLLATPTVTNAFTRTLIAYESDGLRIAGFMNTPFGAGPFPVVIVLHGYVDPARYRILTYTTPYADALARQGYLVVHPNLRNFPPSDTGPDPFRVGLAVDVLNLIALIKDQAGRPGLFAQADADRIGLWGHSMGGGVALRVLVVSPDVRAAVLYGSMSGDERQNYEKIAIWSGRQRGLWELSVPEAELRRIAPLFFLDRITAAVSIHHGEADTIVPLAWSLDLCERLQALGKTVECFTYPDQPHTFVDEGYRLFIERTQAFFARTLGTER
jgi:dipeptidyl aminopeptidase/acylaminoacyl peptidase